MEYIRLHFGVGNVYAIPQFDALGNAIAVPTPCKVQGLQDFSIDISGDVKEFHGSNSFPLDIARGKVKVSGKLKGAFFDAPSLNALFFGSPVVTGTMKSIRTDDTGAVIPTTPFTITPTVPSSGTISEDLGVLINGVALTRVASAPVTGQYSYNAGVYTFAAADVGKTAFINFSYTFSGASASKIELNNAVMGGIPKFKLYHVVSRNGKTSMLELDAVVAPKLNFLSAKNDDYSVPEIEFQAMVNANGNSIGRFMVFE